jgi:uncharacterized membrane protein YfcA
VLPLAIPVGVLVGAVMGALGGGGAIIAIPALVFLLGQSPQEATSASLVIVGLTALVGVAQHGRAGRVRFADGALFALLGAAGAVLGARVAVGADPDLLLVLFAALLLVVAAVMWRRSRPGTASAEGREDGPWLSLRPWRVDLRRGLVVLAVASGVGLLTGFFGVGGGFAIVPALTLVLGLPMRVAVGTSLWVIALTSAVSLTARLGGGLQLDWALVAAFTAAAVAGTLVGGRLAGRADPRVLQRAFAALLVLVAVGTAVRSVPGLF